MKKLKSNDDTLDRLSELPDSLILEILSFMEMRDVVRTTLLSKRWRYLWTTIPCLQFCEYNSDSVRIRNFVNGALALWRGGHLRKFSIRFTSVSESVALLSRDIDLWVQFAKERKVEILHICLCFHGPPLYCLPKCLYECSSLRKIFLMGCNLQIVGNVRWDRLNSLDLSRCLISEDVINKVLSSSLQLETLSLYGRQHCKNLTIRSSSLKRLLIYSINYQRQTSIYSRKYDSCGLTIWAPNLKKLYYLGKPYRNSLLTDVSSLMEVHLDFRGYRPAVDGEALCQMLPAINHVESVLLSNYCFEMLRAIKGTNPFTPLSNVQLLRICSGLAELRKLVGLLEFFPKLEMLIINWRYGQELLEFNAENYIISEANRLKSNLSQLKRVEIFWTSYNAAIFQFIEFLLTHAIMIEKMVIQRRVTEVVESEDMFLAAQKVVSLQRSFPSVELILYQIMVKK